MPGIPRQQSIDDAPAAFDDLRRDQQERIQECFEFHADDTALLGAVFLRPATAFRQPQREPCFERPGQGGHDHVCPVAEQVVDWHLHGTNAILELLDDVFLIAAVVRFSNHVVLAEVSVVGDEEEIAIAPTQVELPFLLVNDLRSTTMR